MNIRFNNLFGGSKSKKVPAHANRELVRKAELAREKVWGDAYMSSRMG